MHDSNRYLLEQMKEIVSDYASMGYSMTLRQLYYQLVARNEVSNTMNSYVKVGRVLKYARENQEIDWDDIVDKARTRIMPSHFYTMRQFVDNIRDHYRVDRWENQKNYVEAIVEKEALSGVLEPVARELHVSLLVGKGYPSASVLKQMAQRTHSQFLVHGKKSHILYFGDHDPSGLDMIRDVQSRLDKYFSFAEVHPIALTMEQIKQNKLPHNPAKKTDPRWAYYRTIYGNQSWELDALPPDILSELFKSAVHEYMNIPQYKRMLKKEEDDKIALDQIIKKEFH